MGVSAGVGVAAGVVGSVGDCDGDRVAVGVPLGRVAEAVAVGLLLDGLGVLAGRLVALGDSEGLVSVPAPVPAMGLGGGRTSR